MKTKILYVITSSEKDIYFEQLFISITSLRRKMPTAHITVLTDTLTYSNLSDKRKAMLGTVNEVVPVELEKNLSGQTRSRILKTGAREYVKGDFLFIDCDTIIERDLSEIDNYPFEIAACWDTHSSFQQNPYRRMCMKHAKKMGYDISAENEYFNSGVIFARDTLQVREFYRLWSETYHAGFKKGVTMDQPSFAIVNKILNYPVKTLPDVWNCELKHGIRYLKDAKIIHYLCTNVPKLQGEELFILNNRKELEEVRSSGIITEKIDETINDPFKGLSRITHCFGSNMVDLFRTISFHQLVAAYSKSGTDMWFEKMARRIAKLVNSITLKR